MANNQPIGVAYSDPALDSAQFKLYTVGTLPLLLQRWLVHVPLLATPTLPIPLVLAQRLLLAVLMSFQSSVTALLGSSAKPNGG